MLEWEESVGKAWDKFLSQQASLENLHANVEITSLQKSLTLFYHLLGGDKGKEIKVTDKRKLQQPRNLLQRISGYGQNFYLTWQDDNAIYLPPSLSILKTKEENTLLYFWLIAMSTQVNITHANIIEQNQQAINYLCNRYIGFKNFYQQAIEYLLSNIPHAQTQTSTQNTSLHYPNILWIYPALTPKNTPSPTQEDEENQNSNKKDKVDTLKMKKKANQIDDNKETDGFMAFLPEGLMSLLEQVNLDRSEDDSFDEEALYNAQELDEITLGQKKANLNARLKMDLDLACSMQDEYPIGKGYYIDEWDYRKKRYLKNYVCIKPTIATDITPMTLPKRLKKMVKNIQSQLDLLELNRIKNSRLPYGDEININSWIDYKGHQNKSLHHQNFYESLEKKTRDMATLILADTSLSTEAGITSEIRVIDMIKDGLMVFAQSLEKLQDQFAMYAFSSKKNTHVKFHIIKNFAEKYSDLTQGRIDALKPGYYTRLGAAIRESAKILQRQKSENKLLLIISDGKPNDIDRYDGRYGIEDTKKAIEEVKQEGMTPFCITIDIEAKEYLSYLFGKNGYVVIRDSKKLPKVIPEVYINLTK